LRILSEASISYIVVGGVAGIIHGAARATYDLDILYERSDENLGALAAALAPIRPYLRGAPPGLPFELDVRTLRQGLHFTLSTDLGPLDLLGEIAGVGSFQAAAKGARERVIEGLHVRVLCLADLIAAKRAAGRPKDLEATAELELLLRLGAHGIE